MMRAMIFAAGFGTRLRPITNHTPKALVKISGTPILDIVIRNLQNQGVQSFMVNTHYLHEKVAEFLKSQPYEKGVHISFEPEILGTGQGLYVTKAFWEDDFLVCNVDILCDADMGKLMAYHKETKAIATLAVNDVQADSMLLFDEHKRLCGRQVKGKQLLYKHPVGAVTAKGFCGIHAVSPLFFEKLGGAAEFSIIDDYINLVKQGEEVQSWDIHDAYWVDIGTIDTLRQVEEHLPKFVRDLHK